MSVPLFSCVIPVKGKRPFIREAIDSLKPDVQGIDPDELEIIIQDGDVDADSGQSDALNKGFAKAKGEWFFWLNADDILLPNSLQCVKRLIHPTTYWIAGNTVYIDSASTIIDVRWDYQWHEVLYKHMPVWSMGPSAFFRRSLFTDLGGFNVCLRYVMDIDLWSRMAKRGYRYIIVNEQPIWAFRVHEDSLTSASRNKGSVEREYKSLLNAYGMRHYYFWRNCLRVVNVVSGAWAHALSLKRHVKSKKLWDVDCGWKI